LVKSGDGAARLKVARFTRNKPVAVPTHNWPSLSAARLVIVWVGGLLLSVKR